MLEFRINLVRWIPCHRTALRSGCGIALTTLLLGGCGPFVWGRGYPFRHPETRAVANCNVPTVFPFGAMGYEEVNAIAHSVMTLEAAGFQYEGPGPSPRPLEWWRVGQTQSQTR
jgi:hypothetical protein